MKVPYKKVYNEWGHSFKRVKLTGLCKKITGGPYGDREYFQMKEGFFKYWVPTQEIVFFEEESQVIYECTCGWNLNAD